MSEITPGTPELARRLMEAGDRVALAEAGSGPVIQYALSEPSGSSGILFGGCFPNHQNLQQALGKPEKTRSVSLEAVREMMNCFSAMRMEVDTILVSSWQIPSSKPVDTHGWMGIQHNDKRLFAHLTLAVGQSRAKARALIAHLGLKLLLSKADPALLEGCLYADQMEDGEGKHLVGPVLDQYNHLVPGEEHLVFVNEYGQMMRPLDRFRAPGGDEEYIYKGSFNVVTNAHYNIGEVSTTAFGKKPAFMINAQTVDKGGVDGGEIARRIQMINGLGYGVMVCRDGTFVGNSRMFAEKGVKKVTYVAGADTAKRLSLEDIRNLNEMGHVMYVADRPGSEVPDNPLFRRLDVAPMHVSSTAIRNGEVNWRESVPERVHDLYEELYLGDQTA